MSDILKTSGISWPHSWPCGLSKPGTIEYACHVLANICSKSRADAAPDRKFRRSRSTKLRFDHCWKWHKNILLIERATPVGPQHRQRLPKSKNHRCQETKMLQKCQDEFVVHVFPGHLQEADGLQYQVSWYGYEAKDDTVEPYPKYHATLAHNTRAVRNDSLVPLLRLSLFYAEFNYNCMVERNEKQRATPWQL